jgi:hypothetical protein
MLPFILLVAVYSIIRLGWAKPGKLRSFIFAGLATGAAATTKITGLSVLIPLIAYPFVEGFRIPRFPYIQPKRDKRFPFALVVFVATIFALTVPFLVFVTQGGSDSGSTIQETATAAVDVTQGLAGRFTSARVSSDTYALSPFPWSLPWHLSSTLPK